MSLVAAKQELFDLFSQDATGAPVAELTTVTRVYPVLPRASDGPVSLVIWSGPGGDALELGVSLLALSSPDVGVEAGQAALDQCVDDVNGILAADSTFGRASYTYDYDQGNDRFVAQWSFTVGREDF